MTCNCTACGSDQTQAVRMILATGIQEGGGATLAYSRRGGIGIAGTGVTLRTNLAARFDPGSPPMKFGTLLYPFLGTVLCIAGGFPLLFLLNHLFLNGGEINGIFLLSAAFFGLLLFWGIALFVKLRSVNSEYEEALARWEERDHFAATAWVCLRCGQTWTPDLPGSQLQGEGAERLRPPTFGA